MATYCTDPDLQKVRPNIVDLGVNSWATQREEAFDIINRVIKVRWWMSASRIMGIDPATTDFNPAQVKAGSLTRLEVYKTLELAYLHLMKGGKEEDGFERQMEIFRTRYNDELLLVLDMGVEYDFDADGTIADTEKFVRAPRRLMRS